MAWVADALLLLGLLVMTVGVFGVVRLPDVYTQLHAASKAAFLGVVLLLAAACLNGDGATITKAVVVAGLLTLTTPVASHVIAQAALRRGEPLRTPGAVDETGRAVRDGVPSPPEMRR